MNISPDQPNIDPHTHRYVAGLYEDKFGISDISFDTAMETMRRYPLIDFYGLQFHIGSQIMEQDVFAMVEGNQIVCCSNPRGWW